MKEEIYNEQELKALEDEIRALGVPYSQNEPDERYFANFRVHLMERIEEKETKQSIFASVLSWLTTSPLRSLSLCAVLAAVMVAALLINPSSEPKIAQLQPIQQSAVTDAQPIAQPQVKQDIAIAPKENVEIIKSVKNTTIAVKTKTDKSLDTAIGANDLASMDETLTGNESEDPVSYENLSEADLESVVKIAEGMQ
jgi:hypothetical protein